MNFVGAVYLSARCFCMGNTMIYNILLWYIILKNCIELYFCFERFKSTECSPNQNVLIDIFQNFVCDRLRKSFKFEHDMEIRA